MSAVQDAIARAAQEEGVDPAFALATAERESKFDPNARASSSIYGLFQMSRNLRAQYGSGDSGDPYDQAKGWARFINDTKGNLTARLGREPTNDELYLAHYFGEGRAARLISGQTAGSTNVSDVFTPRELKENPEIAKAGTVGSLMTGIGADMEARQARFGGGGSEASAAPRRTAGVDFASYGDGASPGQQALGDAIRYRARQNLYGSDDDTPSPPRPIVPGQDTPSSTGEGDQRGGYRWTKTVSAQPDFSAFGPEGDGPSTLTSKSTTAGTRGQPIDFASFGNRARGDSDSSQNDGSAQGIGPETMPPDLMPHGMDTSGFRPSTNVEDVRDKPALQKAVESVTRLPIESMAHPFSPAWPASADGGAGQNPGTEVDVSQFGLPNTADALSKIQPWANPPAGEFAPVVPSPL